MRISDWSSDVCSSDLSLNLFTSWGDPARVAAEEEHFARLWANKAKRAVVLDVPQAARDDLLRFLPDPGELPSSEERRVGKEGVRTCRSRWSPSHSKKKKTKQHETKHRCQNNMQ